MTFVRSNNGHMLAHTLMLLSLGALSSCGKPSAPEALHQAVLGCDGSGHCTSGPTSTIDIISPSTCSVSSPRRTKCKIPELWITPPLTDSAVPLRSVFKVIKTGNCNTNYDLTVSAQPDDAEPTRIGIYDDPVTRIRLPQGAAARLIHSKDIGPWTPYIALDPSCRITLDVSFNEPDIDTKVQAQGVIAVLQAAVSETRAEAEKSRQLLLLFGGYDFIHKLSESFHQELTNDLMQELRRAAADGNSALTQILSSNACTSALSQNDQDNLTRLIISLVAVGDPADWTNPDGTTKKLSDFFGPAAAEIEKSILEIEKNANFQLEEQYKAAYKAAGERVVTAEARLAEANVTLQGWLQ